MLCPIFYLGLLALLAQLSYSLPGLSSIAIRNRIDKRQSTPSTIVSGGTTWLYRGCESSIFIVVISHLQGADLLTYLR